jgi:predicted component of type VI protein secretion system
VELELTIETKDTGAVAVERLTLTGRLVLGRGPESPVALDGPLISREHVAFEFREGKLTLEDLSVNGSWLNGQTLQRGRRYEVTAADRVQLPGYELRCVIPQKEPEAKAAAAALPPPKSVRQLVSGMEVMVAVTVLAAVGLALIFFRA